MNAPATLTWFARHEMTLAWRDWLSMMKAGSAVRSRTVAVIIAGFILAMHAIAYALLEPVFRADVMADKPTLVVLTGSIALAFCMMLSQALESVTRAFYSRQDLDLILSSPAASQNVFAVRMSAITVTTASMSATLLAPFINVAVLLDGPKWLGAYVLLIGMAAIATSLSLVVTMALFRSMGARRTRLAAQIVAAVVGASFLIGIQIVAILSYGNLSRFSVLRSNAVVSHAPETDSWLWLPAEALLGNTAALIGLVLLGGLFFSGIVALYAGKFAERALAAAGQSESHTQRVRGNTRFRGRTAMQALRHKEWVLLRRDPWLASQTLMQVLYLIPPAVLLWRSYADSTTGYVILVPVLVMAIGQLAGGLAWLAISGEDAPDLVASAPVSRTATMRAKIEAVLAVIVCVGAPMVLGLLLLAPWVAFVAAVGLLAASTSAITIQMLFRGEARRAQFRRRQTASRAATFSEAFSSIMWAGAAALAAAESWFAIALALLALLVLGVAWLISPHGDG